MLIKYRFGDKLNTVDITAGGSEVFTIDISDTLTTVSIQNRGIDCNGCWLDIILSTKDNTERYHLNLYGINKDGKEVMFTKDHILPVSKGGRDHISNYRTMCETCNKNRGNDTKKLSLNNRVKIMANKTDIGRKIITKHIIEHPVYLV